MAEIPADILAMRNRQIGKENKRAFMQLAAIHILDKQEPLSRLPTFSELEIAADCALELWQLVEARV